MPKSLRKMGEADLWRYLADRCRNPVPTQHALINPRRKVYGFRIPKRNCSNLYEAITVLAARGKLGPDVRFRAADRLRRRDDPRYCYNKKESLKRVHFCLRMAKEASQP